MRRDSSEMNGSVAVAGGSMLRLREGMVVWY